MYDSINDTKRHIWEVQRRMTDCIEDLAERAREHDRSKLKSPEKEIFDEFTPKLKDSVYGSDEYKEFLKSMKVGLDHHYATYRHHPEHFKEGIKEMNLIDLLEMLCDWDAATKRHETGDIRKSIELNQARFGYSDELKGILTNTINYLEGSCGWKHNP